MDHGACVDAWLDRSKQLSPLFRKQLFEAALAALWTRTAAALGGATVAAITHRVLSSCAREVAWVSSIDVDSNGIVRLDPRDANAGSPDERELIDGMRCVLVELLTVLGDLTAGILTPALHAELSRVELAPDEPSEAMQSHTRTKVAGTGHSDSEGSTR